MSTLREAFNRLRYLGRRSRFGGEMDDEIQFHIDARATELQETGLSPEEALRQARLEFGWVTTAREDSRAAWQFRWLTQIPADLRFGFRMLRRSPGVSLLAILCLTLGIGANAAVFSWIEGILLRPYPRVLNQDRMVAMVGTARGKDGFDAVSWPDFQDLRKNATLFDAFIAEKIVGATLSLGDRSERAAGSVVSSNYFDALGVTPVLGRGFLPAEESGRNAHPVVVISYQEWKDRFRSDPQIIGKTQVLNNVPHTIVGVAPEGFYGTFVGYAFQFWVPISMQETFEPGGYKLEDRDARWIEGFTMLKPGVSSAQAQQELSALAQRLEAAYPAADRGRGLTLVPLWKTPFNSAGALMPTLAVALAVAVLVLLIACANVGNLLLVRSLARRHEMTVRLALGAARGRLVRQLLTEGLILSAFAAAGGILFANWARNALVLILPFRGVPLFLPGELDWRVLGLSIGVCLTATLLFGLVPALQGSNLDLAGTLKADSGSVVGGRGKSWFRSSLVLVQVSLSFVLLVGAALVIQSLERMRSASPGFSTEDVLQTAMTLYAPAYDEPRARHFQDELMDCLHALTGVKSAAYARVSPFSYRTYSVAPIAVEGYTSRPDEQPSSEYNEVSPGYFATLGIPLVEGREFTRADNESAPLVAIVNQTMAALFWSGQGAVGKRMQVRGRYIQIVGIARDAKYRSFQESPQPFFYVPLRQNFSPTVAVFVRTPLSAKEMSATLARAMHSLDPGLPLYEMITLREQVNRMTSAQQIAVTLLGVFGGLALLLAAIGLYGVMSYVVSQGTRELGLRMALGARRADLVRLVMSQGLALTAGGLALGAAVALGTTRLLGYLLYKVGPRDPLSFGLAFSVLMTASLLACFLPAWRATRSDPARILRD